MTTMSSKVETAAEEKKGDDEVTSQNSQNPRFNNGLRVTTKRTSDQSVRQLLSPLKLKDKDKSEKLITFEIKSSEILEKENCVVSTNLSYYVVLMVLIILIIP